LVNLTAFVKQHPIGHRKNDLFRWAASAGWRRVIDYRQLSRQLRILKSSTSTSDLDDVYDALLDFPEFKTDQKRQEIIPLLRMLADRKPRFICEIGTSFGGTLFQLARVSHDQAKIISIDCGLSVVRARVHEGMANNSQRIVCLRTDSRAKETVERVRRLLGKNKLDFLLIDGDHSYEGVSADFKNYAPLVRAGGLIAFHDVLPDYKTKLGLETGNWTGGVPEFWQEIKSTYRNEELLEDEDQDGYGIGLVHW
jgi:cephalosporin hydroxylase